MLNARELSAEKILKLIEESICNASNMEEAIELASYYGSFAAVNYLPIYDGGKLELDFLARFSRNLPEPEHFPTQDSIHVISSAYPFGGHTRLMERLAEMHENAPDLLITCKSYVDYKSSNGNKIFNAIFDFSSASLTEKLEKSILLLSMYTNVVLHIHPNDFVSALAVRVARKNGLTNAFFVNHADHMFSFGRSAANRVLEVSAFGEALGKIRCPGLISSFIGIPIPIKFNKDSFDFNPANRWNILISGSSWKLKPNLGYSLQSILKNLLIRNSQVDVTVVGVRPIRDYWWWLLKFLFLKRIELRVSVSFEKYSEILSTHSFVLDSFPVTGGTAFPEAVLSGKIAIGIKGPVVGYSSIDCLRVNDACAIDSIITNPHLYKMSLMKAMKDMESIHGIIQVKRRYISILAGFDSVNLLLPNFRGDPLFFEKCARQQGSIKLPHHGESASFQVLLLEFKIFLFFNLGLAFGSSRVIFANILRMAIFVYKQSLLSKALSALLSKMK